jgi:uncharacterized RDD family membrane protein YckC
MSQGQDWNAPGAQAYQQSPTGQAYPQAAVAPLNAYGAPGMAPGMPGARGFYRDESSGMTLPEGTTRASVGQRVGAYFLGMLLCIVTLSIGYVIWGLISWSKGQTPAQQVLNLQTWKLGTQTNATWGTMFLRGLCWEICGIPFLAVISLWTFFWGREHRPLHDMFASTVVLHDPNKVLRPAQ